MKRMTVALMLAAAVLTASTALAHRRPTVRSAGIGFRGTYWSNVAKRSNISVRVDGPNTEVYTDGGGGWIYFFSRANEYWVIEFGIGAIGTEVVERSNFLEREVDVSGVLPVTLGLRHDLLPLYSPSALRPYFTLGGGPYWVTDVQVRERYFGHDLGEEVEVVTNLEPGGYLGAGMNFMPSSWLGVNFDVKHHFIDFNVKDERSGWEYGIGFNVSWGNYRPNSRW